jgi:hypothetical protein
MPAVSYKEEIILSDKIIPKKDISYKIQLGYARYLLKVLEARLASF